jgi:hypothetical protein
MTMRGAPSHVRLDRNLVREPRMKAFPAVAVMAALAPFAAAAQDAPGATLCYRQLENTLQMIQRDQAALSQDALRDAERRLVVARGECATDPVLGEAHLSNLHVSLGMAEAQTARVPSVEVDDWGDGTQ